jgi:hypothetical protein
VSATENQRLSAHQTAKPSALADDTDGAALSLALSVIPTQLSQDSEFVFAAAGN